MIKSDVWQRHGTNEMSRNMFYLVMAGVLTWGFGATAYAAGQTADWQPGLGMLLLVGLGLPLLGIVISLSANPLISFVGFNLVAIPFGAILGPMLAMGEYAHPGAVQSAALLTGGVSGMMMVSGLLFPNFYSKIGGALFMGLLCLVVVRILGLFIPALGNLTLIDYLAAGLFSLYIGYDMWRASRIAATLDNAVDCALALYLDIINLFLSIYRIMTAGSKN